MDIYRPGTCQWCFDYGDPIAASEFVHTEIKSSGMKVVYELCASCNEFSNEHLEEWIEDSLLSDVRSYSVERYEPEKVLWHRGQKIQIVRPSRPRQTGTVIHSYLSRANYEWMVNCVIDGRKWPAAYPARFVEEYVPTRRVA